MMRSYSKVIIDLNGKRSIDLVSKTPCLCGAFSLAGAVSQFIEENITAHRALQSASVAGGCNVSLTRALYKFLKAQDFYPELAVGHGYTKRLVDPSTALQDEIKERGHDRTVIDLKHGIVRVSGIVIDLTHRRLGSTYQQVYNFPFREFKDYWKNITSMTHVADINPYEMNQRIKHAQNLSELAMLQKRHGVPA